LTKDIPKDFIDWMTEKLRDQIHIQSHVPDFSSEAFRGAMSGAAIERLLFDFENVVSAAEADFEEGLYDRIKLINTIYKKAGRLVIPETDIVITHKRNMPLNLAEFSDTALKMKGAGFSRYLIADMMPDDVVPDVEQELERQDEDMQAFMPDIDAPITGELMTEELVSQPADVQATALNGAQTDSLLKIIEAVATGVLTQDTARPLISAAFPGIGDQDINDMLANIKPIQPEQAPLTDA